MTSTDRFGIDHKYLDAHKQWRAAPRATIAAIETAMGVAAGERPADPRLRVVVQGDAARLGRGRLTLESGGELSIVDALPLDAPLGYHQFHSDRGGEPIEVIVSPGKCLLPPPSGVWGWSAQLYAARSRASWGIGDLADLRQLSQWARRHAAAFTLVNPLSAPAPTQPQESSPYYPSTRRFRNPLYLRIEDVPAAAALGDKLQSLANAGRALNANRLIDRDEVYRLKLAALESLWSQRAPDARFEAYCAQQDGALQQFAVYCVLAEKFGRDWRSWPQEYQRHDSPAVVEADRQNADRVRFFAWLQWLVELQLAAATEALPIVQDLPVGVDPGGADAWVWQDVFAPEMSVGAPPDIYNTLGQNWGLPPWTPHKLRAAHYRPFIETLRAALRHAGGLRIDHVLGLFRLFWIPYGATAREGTFVRYNADELLAIVALESHRAGAFVIGEDLGTVETGVLEKLAAAQLLSYRVLWFEEVPPTEYPALSLAAITTHDLPTVAGLWTGDDLAAQELIGQQPNAAAIGKVRGLLQKATGAEPDADVDDVVLKAHQALAAAPSLVKTPMLDDALAVRERPNMPGTIDQWPNWRLALPLPLEEIVDAELPRKIGEAMADSVQP